MKIGLSFSRCLRDIYDKKVTLDEVIVIIARTDFNPTKDNEWNDVWRAYTQGGLSNAEWMDYLPYEEEFRELTTVMFNRGLIHQPRQFQARPLRMRNYWLDCSVSIDEHTPAQQKAWDNYNLITNLS